ncbi:FAD-dependent oxidoreductase [Phytoactinopolyspora mesophila]|uniref:ferredoxin--NADP(+) reductase n=1 Tax=Phytoactinopolyspora mesophila TaxID=2650750 RepID=A0A7K3MBV8_9ACTN|nr:FAD-dependent oxidoreductase [Phytoactinopolyspora mesophila]NDL60756.1 NADP oxidoreductase [Phytoactinopolyspora mesophila]
MDIWLDEEMEHAKARTAAIIGAGPAGLYLLAELLEAGTFRRIDVFEAAPAPFGLVRYGVAPDHPKTRGISRVLAQGFETTEARYFGNVTVGKDVTLEELRRSYDAVAVSTGMRGDRRLNIAGEDLPGSIGASELVAWYTGHPAAPKISLPEHLRTAVVIGAGNVALDIARILARDAESLVPTSMPRAVVDALKASTLRDVHVVARRGPAQAKFTSPELREIGKLDDVDVVIDPACLKLEAEDQAEIDTRRQAKTIVKVTTEWAQRPATDAARRIHFHFWRRPVRILGDTAVAGVELEPTRPGTAGPLHLTAELLIRAIGYRGSPIPGLPFDEATGTVPSDDGRVVDHSGPVAGIYVTGWLRRGPTGVIGTNRPDAAEVAESILADMPDRNAPGGSPEDVELLLASRGADRLTWDDWRRLETYETELGQAQGGDPIVVDDVETVLRVIAHGES